MNNEQVLPLILWTDEVTFTRNGTLNFHNTHYWANDNPKVVRRIISSTGGSWAGITGGKLIASVEIP